MNSCGDCNQHIDSKTGLICSTCRIPFCIGNCLKNHLNHSFTNLPFSHSGNDITSKVLDADKSLSSLKIASNRLLEFLRKFDSEISTHQLKLFTIKHKIADKTKTKQQISTSKSQVDSFNEKHNNILNYLVQVYGSMFEQANKAYSFWGNVSNYNFEEIIDLPV